MSNTGYTAVKIDNRGIRGRTNHNALVTDEKYFLTLKDLYKGIQNNRKFHMGDHFLCQKVFNLPRNVVNTGYIVGDEKYFEALGLLKLRESGKIKKAFFRK